MNLFIKRENIEELKKCIGFNLTGFFSNNPDVNLNSKSIWAREAVFHLKKGRESFHVKIESDLYSDSYIKDELYKMDVKCISKDEGEYNSQITLFEKPMSLKAFQVYSKIEEGVEENEIDSLLVFTFNTNQVLAIENFEGLQGGIVIHLLKSNCLESFISEKKLRLNSDTM